MFNSFLDGSKPSIESSAVSNATGLGSYAISHLNPEAPLENVTLVGLTVSKTTRAAGDRVLLAYIDNFQLLNWTFRHHGGAMFLRGDGGAVPPVSAPPFAEW
jgi:hypothetical protein